MSGKTVEELETELEEIDSEMALLSGEVDELVNGTEGTPLERQRRLSFVDQRRFVLYHRRNALSDALRFTRAWGPGSYITPL